MSLVGFPPCGVPAAAFGAIPVGSNSTCCIRTVPMVVPGGDNGSHSFGWMKVV